MSAIGGRIAASATPLRRWAVNQDRFGSDSDSPGALSEGESAMGGGGAGDSVSMSQIGDATAAEDSIMEPKLSPREAISMEKRLWKVRCANSCSFKCLNQAFRSGIR